MRKFESFTDFFNNATNQERFEMYEGIMERVEETQKKAVDKWKGRHNDTEVQVEE